MRRPHTIPVVLAFMILAPLFVAWTPARAQDATPAGDCPATSEQENQAIVQAWYDAIDAGDVEAFDAVLASVVVQHAADFADAQGVDEIKTNFAPFIAAFPDIHHEIDQVVAADDFVAVRVIGQGTHQGEFMGIPATGNEVAWSSLAIYRIECGKVAEHWSEVDAVGRLQELGAIPEVIPPVAATHAPAASTIVPATPAGACPATTEEENEALVLSWFDVWNEGNFEITDELLHPDHVHHGSLHRATTGSDSRIESLSEVRAAFPDFNVSVDLMFSTGDRVVVRWTATGTHEADYRGFPATGNEIAYTTNNIFRVECGTLVEAWAEADLLSLFRQIGAIEWPPAEAAASPEAGG